MSATWLVGARVERDARSLAGAGIETARLEARLLASHALAQPVESLVAHPETPVESSRARYLDALVGRRLEREPLAYILGVREFWSLPIGVTPATLIPRPDSETLVEAALQRVSDPSAPRRILDLGTGSGCLLLALLSELPNAWGIGLDVSRDALAVAQANASALGLSHRTAFVCGDWGEALATPFDIVIANPPYVRCGDIPGLAPEIARYEPRSALDGGMDGLSAYRRLAPSLTRLLSPSGHALLEVGTDQSEAVSALLRRCGFQHIEIKHDLTGISRCVAIAGENRKLMQKKLGNAAFPD